MREEDGASIGLAARDALHRALSGKDRPLVLAILAALPRIGDGSFLRNVRWLAEVASPEEADEEVGAAARAVLPLLETRVETEAQRATLLRASAPEDAAQTTLVRPAGITGHDHADRLLRSAGEEEAEQAANSQP